MHGDYCNNEMKSAQIIKIKENFLLLTLDKAKNTKYS
jgi:hypothetical protein